MRLRVLRNWDEGNTMTKRLPPNEWHKDDDLLAVDLNDTFAAKVPAQATAPTSPYVGMVWVDTSIAGTPKGMVWDGTKWSSFSGGLTGLGGWADISDTPTSTYTDANGVKWNVWTFTANGTLNVSKAGMLDCLVVGGGGGSYSTGGGSGGRVIPGIQSLAAAAHAVVVGAAGSNGSDGSHASSLGPIIAAPVVFSTTAWTGSGTAALANGGSSYPTGNVPGYHSSITGTDVEYGTGAVPAANLATAGPGAGAGTTGGTAKAGIVIVRRPS
jgi:hypothetical protein